MNEFSLMHGEISVEWFQVNVRSSLQPTSCLYNAQQYIKAPQPYPQLRQFQYLSLTSVAFSTHCINAERCECPCERFHNILGDFLQLFNP